MSEREIATDRQEWRKRGSCRSNTLSEISQRDKLFFMGRGGKANRAQEICNRCPVKRNCLAFALYYKEEEGIWGGMTPDDRRDMPEFLKELMMLEAADLIDVGETRDPLQWLPIIFPEPRSSLDDVV
ncbi:MAG TPA: WhiB family transcriptional regulator [Patescibacteria group bacterium]|nr:WhiB family transcriptional regulator [Patescibacteria group bacterium]